MSEHDWITDSDVLNQTRDALHTAFAIIANARNSLDNGERDAALEGDPSWQHAGIRR